MVAELKKLAGYSPDTFVPAARLIACGNQHYDLIADDGSVKVGATGHQLATMAQAGGVRATAPAALIVKSVIDKREPEPGPGKTIHYITLANSSRDSFPHPFIVSGKENRMSVVTSVVCSSHSPERARRRKPKQRNPTRNLVLATPKGKGRKEDAAKLGGDAWIRWN